MSDAICYADATELATRIRSKDLSPVEVMRAHLQRIEALNPTLQAIGTLVESAMDRIRQAEAALMRGSCGDRCTVCPLPSKTVSTRPASGPPEGRSSLPITCPMLMPPW